MKKILIIGFGGTIAMVVDEQRKALVPAKNVEEILDLVPSIRQLAQIDFRELENLDSTNINPTHWTKLALCIRQNIGQYDGFIVTHGTNTLAYTASALAIALGRGLKKPIVITGSQLPLINIGTDARFNLENSVKVVLKAIRENIAEVMIVFSDLILRGARSVKISESDFRAFFSPSVDPIGRIRSTGIYFEKEALRVDPSVPFDVQPHFEQGVLTIDLTPGQNPSLIHEVLKSGKCKGIILKSHGAGSVPSLGEYSFLPLIRESVHHFKIPVLVSTKFVGGNAYKEVNDEPAVEAIDAGAIPTGDLTDVMAEVKLMWLLAKGVRTYEELRKEMSKSYVEEVTPFWKE